MEFKPNLDEAAERMRRLWAMADPLDRVPCVIRLPSPAPPGGARPLRDASFLGQTETYLRWREEAFRAQAGVPDESIPCVGPRYGHALVSALLGSPIRWEAETTWSVPIVEDWSQVEDLRLDFDNAWGRRFRADLETMLDRAAGRYAVEVYEVEGVSDTMAALRGAQRLCTDLHDAPDPVRRFASKVADLLIEFGRWNLRHCGEVQDLAGGVTTGWALWMPAGSVCTAEDATVLISPEAYRAFVQPAQRRLAGAFAATLLEVHAEGEHQLSEFGRVEGVTMMAIRNPLRMPPERREAVRALRGRKAFFVACRPDEAADLLAFTGARGVCLSLPARNPSEARALLDDLKRWTDRALAAHVRTGETF